MANLVNVANEVANEVADAMANAVPNALTDASDVADLGKVADTAGLSNPANVSVRDLKIQLGANTVIENLDLDVRAGRVRRAARSIGLRQIHLAA